MEKTLVVVLVLFLIGVFTSASYTEQLKHECRMEALKALTDTSKIKEICG